MHAPAISYMCFHLWYLNPQDLDLAEETPLRKKHPNALQQLQTPL
jgi:hypothetical protein